MAAGSSMAGIAIAGVVKGPMVVATVAGSMGCTLGDVVVHQVDNNLVEAFDDKVGAGIQDKASHTNRGRAVDNSQATKLVPTTFMPKKFVTHSFSSL